MGDGDGIGRGEGESWGGAGRGELLLLLYSFDGLVEPIDHKRAHAVDVVRRAKASDGEVSL